MLILEQNSVQHDHSSLQWSRLIISKTVSIAQSTYTKYVIMFHFLWGGTLPACVSKIAEVILMHVWLCVGRIFITVADF